MEQCEKVIIAIGSAQASGTKENPFNRGWRAGMIMEALHDKELEKDYFIIGIEDRPFYGNDASWGEYVFNEIEHQLWLSPDVIFEGYEQIRQNWYDTLEVERVQIDRGGIDVSGTKMREAIKNGDKDFYLQYCATNTEFYFDWLKEILEGIKDE